MNSTSIHFTINELAALGEQNKKLEKELRWYLGKIQKRADEEILSGGAKLSKSEIQSKIGIQFNRFKLFLQNHPDLLGHVGKNKTSRWFLK